MRSNFMLLRRFAIITAFTVALLGCGGGGGGGGADPTPGGQVLPSTFDFGTVTVGNTHAPLEVKINSTGTANLRVTGIALTDDTHFELDLDPSSSASPCGGSSVTLEPDETCSFEVIFSPAAPSGTAYTSSVEVTTNDGTFTVDLTGTSALVSAVTVLINQLVPDCDGNTGTAYVSVIDQGGYPVGGLGEDDFTVEVDDGVVGITGFSGPPTAPEPISIVAVLDYSISITDYPEIVSDMEEGLVEFIDQMGAGDEAAIIKFSGTYEQVGFFDDTKAELISAIRADYESVQNSVVYDAVTAAVDLLATTTNPRKAIVVLTDGDNNAGVIQNVNAVVTNAQAEGTPVFVIALESDNLNEGIVNLNTLADDTGGRVYRASASDNTRNIYWQLASLLYQNQYVLDFSFPPGSDSLTVSAQSDDFDESVSDPRDILCP